MSKAKFAKAIGVKKVGSVIAVDQVVNVTVKVETNLPEVMTAVVTALEKAINDIKVTYGELPK